MNDKDTLLEKLQNMAKNWSKNNSLSNAYSEGIEYEELIRELRELGIDASIELDKKNRSQYNVEIH